MFHRQENLDSTLSYIVWSDTAPDHSVTALASCANNVIVTGSSEGRLCLWKLDSTALQLTPYSFVFAHDSGVADLLFLRHGVLLSAESFVLSLSENGELALFNVTNNGYCVKSLRINSKYKRMKIIEKPNVLEGNDTNFNVYVACYGMTDNILIVDPFLLRPVVMCNQGTSYFSNYILDSPSVAFIEETNTLIAMTFGGVLKSWDVTCLFTSAQSKIKESMELKDLKEGHQRKHMLKNNRSVSVQEEAFNIDDNLKVFDNILTIESQSFRFVTLPKECSYVKISACPFRKNIFLLITDLYWCIYDSSTFFRLNTCFHPFFGEDPTNNISSKGQIKKRNAVHKKSLFEWAGGEFLSEHTVIVYDKAGNSFIYLYNNMFLSDKNSSALFDSARSENHYILSSPLIYSRFVSQPGPFFISRIHANADGNNYFVQADINGRINVFNLSNNVLLNNHIFEWAKTVENFLFSSRSEKNSDEINMILEECSFVKSPLINNIEPVLSTSLHSHWEKNLQKNLQNGFQFKESNKVTCVIFISSTNFVAVGHDSGKIVLLSSAIKFYCSIFEVNEQVVDNSTTTMNLLGHTGRVTVLYYPFDDNQYCNPCTLLSGSIDASIRVWDIIRQQCLICFRHHTAEILTINIVPPVYYISEHNSHFQHAVIAYANDHSISIINTENGIIYLDSTPHFTSVLGVKWRPEDDLVAVLCADGSLWVYDISTKNHFGCYLERYFFGHKAIVALNCFFNDSEIYHYLNFENEPEGVSFKNKRTIKFVNTPVDKNKAVFSNSNIISFKSEIQYPGHYNTAQVHYNLFYTDKKYCNNFFSIKNRQMFFKNIGELKKKANSNKLHHPKILKRVASKLHLPNVGGLKKTNSFKGNLNNNTNNLNNLNGNGKPEGPRNLLMHSCGASMRGSFVISVNVLSLLNNASDCTTFIGLHPEQSESVKKSKNVDSANYFRMNSIEVLRLSIMPATNSQYYMQYCNRRAKYSNFFNKQLLMIFLSSLYPFGENKELDRKVREELGLMEAKRPVNMGMLTFSEGSFGQYKSFYSFNLGGVFGEYNKAYCCRVMKTAQLVYFLAVVKMIMAGLESMAVKNDDKADKTNNITQSVGNLNSPVPSSSGHQNTVCVNVCSNIDDGRIELSKNSSNDDVVVNRMGRFTSKTYSIDEPNLSPSTATSFQSVNTIQRKSSKRTLLKSQNSKKSLSSLIKSTSSFMGAPQLNVPATSAPSAANSGIIIISKSVRKVLIEIYRSLYYFVTDFYVEGNKNNNNTNIYMTDLMAYFAAAGYSEKIVAAVRPVAEHLLNSTVQKLNFEGKKLFIEQCKLFLNLTDKRASRAVLNSLNSVIGSSMINSSPSNNNLSTSSSASVESASKKKDCSTGSHSCLIANSLAFVLCNMEETERLAFLSPKNKSILTRIIFYPILYMGPSEVIRPSSQLMMPLAMLTEEGRFNYFKQFLPLPKLLIKLVDIIITMTIVKEAHSMKVISDVNSVFAENSLLSLFLVFMSKNYGVDLYNMQSFNNVSLAAKLNTNNVRKNNLTDIYASLMFYNMRLINMGGSELLLNEELTDFYAKTATKNAKGAFQRNELQRIKVYEIQHVDGMLETVMQAMHRIASNDPVGFMSSLNREVAKHIGHFNSNYMSMHTIFRSSHSLLERLTKKQAKSGGHQANLSSSTDTEQHQQQQQHNGVLDGLCNYVRKCLMMLVNSVFTSYCEDSIDEWIADGLEVVLHCMGQKAIKDPEVLFAESKFLMIPTVALAKDIRKIIIGTKHGKVWVYDLRNLRMSGYTAHKSKIDCVAVSKNEKMLATFSRRDGLVRVWTMNFGIMSLLSSQLKCVNTLSVSDKRVAEAKTASIEWLDEHRIQLSTGGAVQELRVV